VDFYEVINAETSDLVAPQVVTVIDEINQYSVTKRNLVPGATYKSPSYQSMTRERVDQAGSALSIPPV
jgi:hypothetical protein